MQKVYDLESSNDIFKTQQTQEKLDKDLFENLKKELDNATEEIKQKSLKKNYFEKGIKDNNDILDDDLTIIGIGK